MDMPPELSAPFLKSVFHAHASALQGLRLLIVQHIRHDTIDLLLALRAAGVEVIALLGPAYSEESLALKRARDHGFDAFVCRYEELPGRIAERIDRLPDIRLGVVDTGGYASDLPQADRLLFRVEMTNHGLWQYRAKNCSRVVEIAATTNKSIENIFIGRAIVRAILREMGIESFEGRGLGVVGFGGIGANVSRWAARLGAAVSVCERDPSKLIAAAALGFEPMALDALVDANPVIVGCTGQDPFAGWQLAPQTPRQLFSGSSKAAEFTNLLPHPNLVVRNSGLPINFLHDSLPPAIAEHLFITLMFALIQAHRDPADGIRPLDETRQREANRIWLEAKRYRNLPRD
jgi:hypothetical protein